MRCIIFMHTFLHSHDPQCKGGLYQGLYNQTVSGSISVQNRDMSHLIGSWYSLVLPQTAGGSAAACQRAPEGCTLGGAPHRAADCEQGETKSVDGKHVTVGTLQRFAKEPATGRPGTKHAGQSMRGKAVRAASREAAHDTQADKQRDRDREHIVR